MGRIDVWVRTYIRYYQHTPPLTDKHTRFLLSYTHIANVR